MGGQTDSIVCPWNEVAKDPGGSIADCILAGANAVKFEEFPGYVSGAFFLLLLALLFWYWAGARAGIKSVKQANRVVQKATGRAEFRAKFFDIDHTLRAYEQSTKRMSRRRSMSRGWHEFHETLIVPSNDGSPGPIRNTTRPHAFFNKEDLGFESAFWRQVPGLFVSFGLFFTFLGLIAALNTAGGVFRPDATTDVQRDEMRILLNVASSKFIMSLAGLACSIVFNIAHKMLSAGIDRELLRFCDDLEERLLYLSPESLESELLETVKDQTAQLKAFNMDLAAQIGRALDDNTNALQNELPARLSQVMKEELRPVLEGIGQESTDSVGGMVHDLGQQLHERLNSSLSEIASTLGGVNASLSNLSQELGSSGANVSSEIKGAVASLAETMELVRDSMMVVSNSANQSMQQGSDHILDAMNRTLSVIEANTKESAGALSATAKELVAAADNMGQRVRETADVAGVEVKSGIETAGQGIVESMSAVTERVLAEAENFKAGLDLSLGQPLGDLADAMGQLGTRLQSSASAIDAHRQAVEGAAAATTSANAALTQGTQSLVEAATPIRSSVQNIDATTRRMQDALKETATVLAHSRETVELSLRSLEDAVAQFNTITARYDEIDEKLGAAFRTISREVESAAGQVRQYANDIETNFEKGISSLISAIDGIADFTPPRR